MSRIARGAHRIRDPLHPTLCNTTLQLQRRGSARPAPNIVLHPAADTCKEKEKAKANLCDYETYKKAEKALSNNSIEYFCKEPRAIT